MSPLSLAPNLIRLMLLSAILLATSMSAYAQDDWEVGENLLPNASFEETQGELPSFWKPSTWSGDPVFEVENAFGRSGNKCLKVHSESGADASWSFAVKVQPNQTYRLTAWVKTENVDGNGEGALLNLHELQQEGKTFHKRRLIIRVIVISDDG